MALRSPALWLGNPAVQHTAQNDRLFRAGLLRPEAGQTAANRPLTATSGVLVGPPGTMGEVTLLSNTQFTVNPARWMIYGSASALAGAYEVTNDAVATLAVTAQDATQTRRSYFGVWTGDSFVAGSGDDLPHWGLVDGPLAASNPQLPAAGVLPANWLAVGEFLIPPVGQAVTYTPYDVRTGLRGGILPVTATDTRSGSYPWQMRRHPTLGFQEWNGTAWQAVKSTTTDWQLAPVVGAPYFAHNNLVAGGTGIAPGPGTPGLQYRRDGDRVFWRGWTISSQPCNPSVSGSNPLFTTALPVEYRPPAVAFIWPSTDVGGSSTLVQRFEVGTNGVLYDAHGIAAGMYLCFDDLSYSLS